MTDPQVICAVTVPLGLAGVAITIAVAVYRYNIADIANDTTRRKGENDLELERERLRTSRDMASAKRPKEIFCPRCGCVATTAKPPKEEAEHGGRR